MNVSGAPPRLCILTQYFPPEMGAPQVRLSELGERLIDLGWEVEALTALPNYPTGQVFPGYPRRRPTVETIGRIQTARVPLVPSQKGFIRRLACYLSFAASAAFHGPRLCSRPDVLLFESPPLFLGFAARRLASRWRCPYVMNVSDLWPQSAIEMGVVKPGLATRLAERLELSLYKGAAGVTGQSEEIVASISSRTSTPVQVITNGVDPSRFGPEKADPEARALLGSEPGPVFLFAGLLGLAQGLDQILDVAASLPPEVPGRCVLVGDGPVREALQTRIERERISRVRLVPAQPRERIPALLAAADIAVATLGWKLQGAVPSKIYEAMASSRPLLLIAEGEAARRVERAGCGLTVRLGDLAGAREAWVRLATNADLRSRLGTAGRLAAETEYDRTRIAKRLDEFLRKIIARD